MLLYRVSPSLKPTSAAVPRARGERGEPTDGVFLGMWQKYKGQVAENVACAQRILGVG